MKTYTEQEKKAMREIQNVLISIESGRPVFFSIVKFRDNWGLVKEGGKTIDQKTKWILTEKGKQIANSII